MPSDGMGAPVTSSVRQSWLSYPLKVDRAIRQIGHERRIDPVCSAARAIQGAWFFGSRMRDGIYGRF